MPQPPRGVGRAAAKARGVLVVAPGEAVTSPVAGRRTTMIDMGSLLAEVWPGSETASPLFRPPPSCALALSSPLALFPSRFLSRAHPSWGTPPAPRWTCQSSRSPSWQRRAAAT